MLKLPPLGLYIHFPWCVKKCPYCDFNSHAKLNDIPAQHYVNALIDDFTSYLDDFQGRQIKSIFMGGGTPSLFPTEALVKLFEFLDGTGLVAPNSEITLEANPGTIEHGRFHDYKNMGINRISLGVQSFQNDKLHNLGRIHSCQDVYHAVDALKQAGFDNFNIDLMHGLPQQNLKDALFDLHAGINLNPTHISWYQLTIEPNTAFAVKPPQLPDENTLESIECNGKKLLEKNGYKPYEVSAFSKNQQYQGQHNLNYWQFGDYIGIGAGAHSKITDIKKQQIRRHWKRKNPKLYLVEKTFPFGRETITCENLPHEFMLNALRLVDGFSVELFESNTGLSINVIKPVLTIAIRQKLLIKNNDQYRCTELGRRFLNDATNLFMSESNIF